MSNDTVVSVLAKDFVAASAAVAREAPEYSNLTAPLSRGAGYAEWKVTLPRAGAWRLRVHMTAAESLPCSVAVNGVKQPGSILAETTGGLLADKLSWFSYGPYDFKSGENTVRIDFTTSMPHLRELRFAEMVQSSVLTLDGKTQYVEVADPFDDDAAFTIAMWVKTSVLDDGSTHGIVGKEGDPYRKPSLWLGASKGSLHYDSCSTGGEAFGGSLDGFFEKDKWTHLVWVKRAEKYEFYRNGQFFAERPAPPRVYSRRSSYWLGRSTGYWAGHLARARVWSLACTPEQIRAEMLRSVPVDAPGLVSHWALEDGEGTTARDGAARAAHGAVVGAAAWAKSLLPFADEQSASGSNLPTWQTVSAAITHVTAAQHANGRLAVAVRSKEGALFLLTQEALGSADWKPMQNLAGGFKGRPALGSHADGRLFAAVIGTDDQLHFRQQAGPDSPDWASYQHCPGCLIAEIVAVTNADGRLMVLARGKEDNQLWHTAQTAPNADTWTKWCALGGVLGGPPSVVLTSKGRVEVFARGQEGDLWHAWQDSPGSAVFRPWHPLGGDFVGTPAIGKNADGRFQIFVRGKDDALWHIVQTPEGLWGRWQSLGKAGTGVAGTPSVTTDAAGRLVVFVRGKDAAVWSIRQKTPGGELSDWTFLGGNIVSFALARNADKKIGLFAVGADEQLKYFFQEG